MAKNTFENADFRSIDPPIAGLDDSFDDIIRNFPQALLNAGDDFILPPDFSKDPLTPLKAVRDRHGYVVRGEDYAFGGVQLPNLFAIDVAKPHFCVLGDTELLAISRDSERYVQKDAYGLLGDTMGTAHGKKVGTIPTVEDGETHRHLRDIYNTFLNPGAMAMRSEKLIRPVCAWLIDRLIQRLDRGEDVCLARDLAVPLTYKAMSTMMGVPQDLLPDFVRMGELFFTAPLQGDDGARAADDLYDFFVEELHRRETNPRPDLLAYLARIQQNGKRALSDEDVVVQARFILPAGIDTTWRGLTLVLYTLLSHPKQYADVCNNPGTLVKRAVEEGIRFSPSGFVAARKAAATTEVGGIEIPAGSHITLMQGVVNRDSRRWDNPDVYDIHRDFRVHRTFNAGAHACAGQHLARLEMMTCLEMFAERLSNLKLAVKPEEVEVRGLQIRSPRSVPVCWG